MSLEFLLCTKISILEFTPPSNSAKAGSLDYNENDMRQGKVPACSYFEGNVEHCAWLTVKGLGAGTKHTARKWRGDLWKAEWHQLSGAGVKYGILRKTGMVGLIKCVCFQYSLQGGRCYICSTLLGYLARTCKNGKEYVQLETFAFQCWLTKATNIPLFKGGELRGQWAGRKVFKIRWLHG